MESQIDFHEIRTERFTLRQFSEDDLSYVYDGLSNPEVVRYYGVRFDTLEATKEQMTWFHDLESNGTGIWWAIWSNYGAQFIGAGGLNDLDRTNRKAEVGFWLLPEHWGQGIMKEVMPHICQYGFDNLHLHRIEGFVDSENKNCKRGLAKLNFSFEGTMKECEFKDGRFVSIDIYALIDKYRFSSE